MRRWKWLFPVGAVVIVLCVLFIPNAEFDLHQAVLGDRPIHYRHRDYMDPATQSIQRLEAQVGPLYSTGEHVLGLSVLSNQKNAVGAPTLLILKKNSTTCAVFALSGGS